MGEKNKNVTKISNNGLDSSFKLNIRIPSWIIPTLDVILIYLDDYYYKEILQQLDDLLDNNFLLKFLRDHNFKYLKVQVRL